MHFVLARKHPTRDLSWLRVTTHLSNLWRVQIVLSESGSGSGSESESSEIRIGGSGSSARESGSGREGGGSGSSASDVVQPRLYDSLMVTQITLDGRRHLERWGVGRDGSGSGKIAPSARESGSGREGGGSGSWKGCRIGGSGSKGSIQIGGSGSKGSIQIGESGSSARGGGSDASYGRREREKGGGSGESGVSCPLPLCCGVQESRAAQKRRPYPQGHAMIICEPRRGAWPSPRPLCTLAMFLAVQGSSVILSRHGRESASV
jgi:hypothetical protein